jgi:RNA polymerase sigma-70 factor (ECF subfamily)
MISIKQVERRGRRFGNRHQSGARSTVDRVVDYAIVVRRGHKHRLAFLCIGAWLRAPYFENRSSVATWLLSIARYKALSARERRCILTEPLDDAMSATLVDPSLWADAVIEHKDTARYLQRCLSTLPEEQALLIELVYYRDKSVKKAAVIAGIPENTVKSRMFQARKKLAVLLANAVHYRG